LRDLLRGRAPIRVYAGDFCSQNSVRGSVIACAFVNAIARDADPMQPEPLGRRAIRATSAGTIDDA